MGALIALQFRLMRRGLPMFFRTISGVILVVAILSVSEGRFNRQAVGGLALAPMAMLLIGRCPGGSARGRA